MLLKKCDPGTSRTNPGGMGGTHYIQMIGMINIFLGVVIGDLEF